MMGRHFLGCFLAMFISSIQNPVLIPSPFLISHSPGGLRSVCSLFFGGEVLSVDLFLVKVLAYTFPSWGCCIDAN